MSTRRILLLLVLVHLCLILITSCFRATQSDNSKILNAVDSNAIVIGYSNWAGWWPWAIAEREGMFAKHNLNVKLQWFDDYRESLEALAAGQLDGNCQTLNDTISFATSAVHGEVAISVNHYSVGNDKIIVAEDINTIKDLKGKKVALEEGLVNDFLLTLALQSQGMKRDEVEIVPLETAAAAVAFASGQVDAVGAFPPHWLTALKREGAKELISSARFPGAISDLLVVSQKLIDEQPDRALGLVNTWYDILDFIEQNPARADKIMAQRGEVTLEELQLFKKGTKVLTLKENLTAFADGNDMSHLPHAARQITDFMMRTGFISEVPNLSKILDGRFVRAYANGDRQLNKQYIEMLGHEQQ